MDDRSETNYLAFNDTWVLNDRFDTPAEDVHPSSRLHVPFDSTLQYPTFIYTWGHSREFRLPVGWITDIVHTRALYSLCLIRRHDGGPPHRILRLVHSRDRIRLHNRFRHLDSMGAYKTDSTSAKPSKISLHMAVLGGIVNLLCFVVDIVVYVGWCFASQVSNSTAATIFAPTPTVTTLTASCGTMK